MIECKRCHCTFLNKYNLKRHLMNNIGCICIDEYISRKDLLEELCSKDKKFKCICGKAYTFSQGLSVHKRTCNKEKLLKMVDNLKEEVKEEVREEIREEIREVPEEMNEKLKQELQDKLNKVNEELQYVNEELQEMKKTKPITPKIKTQPKPKTKKTIKNEINDFGKEDTSYISQNFIENCLFQKSDGIVSLLKFIFFHKDHPENRTINIPNIREKKFIHIMKDRKWEFQDKEAILSAISGNMIDIFRDYYNENIEEIEDRRGNDKVNSIDDWLTNIDDEEEHPQLMKIVNDKIWLTLLNNRLVTR